MDEFPGVPYICGTCTHFGRVVRDSDKTGATLDARTCTHPRFDEKIGKCPSPETAACLHHSMVVEHLQKLSREIPLPDLRCFDDRLREAGNLHSFWYGVEQYVAQFFTHFKEGQTRYAHDVRHGSANGLLYCLGHALKQTDPDLVRVEFTNILNDAFEAYLEPAFRDAYINMCVHIDDVLAEVERRYAPLQEEVERLRKEIEELKHENTDSIGPPLGAAVED